MTAEKKELFERIRGKIKMYERVFDGEEVPCPQCDKGNLKGNKNRNHIWCDNPDCNMYVFFR